MRQPSMFSVLLQNFFIINNNSTGACNKFQCLYFNRNFLIRACDHNHLFWCSRNIHERFTHHFTRWSYCFCIASKVIPGLLFTSRRPSPDATFVLDLQNTAKNSDFDCRFLWNTFHRICSYQRKNVVCDGFKDSLRLGLISPHVRVLSIKNNGLQVLEERIMRRLQKLVRSDLKAYYFTVVCYSNWDWCKV